MWTRPRTTGDHRRQFGPMSSQKPSRKPAYAQHAAVQYAAIFLVLWHVGCVLATGVKQIKDFVAPLNGFWVDGLRLASTWGMFSKPPRSADTLVEAVLASGEIVVLSSSYQYERTFAERIRDTRLRKIQAKLEAQPDRTTFGAAYLDYFCRQAQEQYADVARVRLRVEQPDRLDDDNRVVEARSEQIVLERPCPSRAGPPAGPKSPAR